MASGPISGGGVKKWLKRHGKFNFSKHFYKIEIVPACERRLLIYCLIPGHLAVPRRYFFGRTAPGGPSWTRFGQTYFRKTKMSKIFENNIIIFSDSVRPLQTLPGLPYLARPYQTCFTQSNPDLTDFGEF